jgi:hypothetical protein
MKTILGYTIGAVTIPLYCQDAKLVTVTVRLFDVIDPAKELLHAARYSDHSLSNVQRKVQRINELGVSHWLDSTFMGTCIEFELQGSIERGDWYSARLQSTEFRTANLALLGKLKPVSADMKHGADYLVTLIKGLHDLKAVEVTYDRDIGGWIESSKPNAVYTDRVTQSEAVAA